MSKISVTTAKVKKHAFLITVEGKKCESYLKEQSYNDLFAQSPYLFLLQSSFPKPVDLCLETN